MFAPSTGCLSRLVIETALIIGLIACFLVWQGKEEAKKPGDAPLMTNTVLEKIHLAGELTTAVGCVQTVIRSSEVREWLRLQVGSAEILYVGVGQVRAGLDMALLDEKALTVDGDKITVTLPACQVLDEKIDVTKSYIFAVRRSIVLSPEGIHLQSAAEKDALKEIREAAIQAGVLEQAEKQAKILLRYWFQSAGFRTVEFQEEGATVVPASAVSAAK